MTMTAAAPHPGGRRHKLSRERIERMASALRAGNYLEASFAHGGISDATGYAYLKRARELLEERGLELDDLPRDEAGNLLPLPLEEDLEADHLFAGTTPSQRLEVEFLDAMTRAEAASEARLVTNWSLAAEEDWRAGAELLARRFPSRWMRKEGRMIEGNPAGAAVQINTDLCEAVRANPTAMSLAMDLLATVAPQEISEGADPEAEATADVEAVQAINRGDYGEGE